MVHNCTYAHIHRFTLQIVIDVVQPLLLIQLRYKQTHVLLFKMRLTESVTTGMFLLRRKLLLLPPQKPYQKVLARKQSCRSMKLTVNKRVSQWTHRVSHKVHLLKNASLIL
jgi:hypothetical protein